MQIYYQYKQSVTISPLICPVQVSWLRHHTSSSIPQLLAVNNITTTLNARYRAVVSGAWTEFVMVIKDVKDKDSGQFECQVSGPKHSSLNKKIHLQVIGMQTDIWPFVLKVSDYCKAKV